MSSVAKTARLLGLVFVLWILAVALTGCRGPVPVNPTPYTRGTVEISSDSGRTFTVQSVAPRTSRGFMFPFHAPDGAVVFLRVTFPTCAQ